MGITLLAITCWVVIPVSVLKRDPPLPHCDRKEPGVETRPTPTGYQHWLELRLRRAPDTRFTDPVRALVDMESGMTQPVVEVLEEHTDGALISVSVFSENSEPSLVETAAIEGLAAELRFADG